MVASHLLSRTIRESFRSNWCSACTLGLPPATLRIPDPTNTLQIDARTLSDTHGSHGRVKEDSDLMDDDDMQIILAERGDKSFYKIVSGACA